MGLQAKPQLVEAVMFFRAGAIGKEMHLAEFEAVLDGVVSLADFADQQIQAAYVLISTRLHIRAVTFFLIDFDEAGRADTGWNIPLRHLAEQGAPGPDLGGGAIRIACRSRCPVAWHQMHLWDPSLKPGRNELLLLRDAARRNHLGILVEETDAARGKEGAGVSPQAAKTVAASLARRLDQRHRLKTAQLLRQQRLRLHSLTRQYDERSAHQSLAAERRERDLQAQLEALREALGRQERLNGDLRVEAEQARKAHKELLGRLRVVEHQGLGLERLAAQGVMFVAYHPGAGHLTIPPADMDRYQADPQAYVAAKCLVSPEHYRDWLAHFQQPTCAARLPSGDRCALPIDRLDTPARFVRGESDCCARHRGRG